MGYLMVLAALAQCAGYSAGYTTSYAYAAPTYYNAVTYVPYVQAVKFVAVEPSYNDLYPSLVAGELRASRRYEAMEKQAEVMERLEAALERMSAPAPAPVTYRARADYRAAGLFPSAPSGQEMPQPAYSAPQAPAKAPLVYSVPQTPAKAPPTYSVPQTPAKAPPVYSVPQTPAKAPPVYSVPQTPAKAPPTYSAPQVPAKESGYTPYGGVEEPTQPIAPEPIVANAMDGFNLLGEKCAACHTAGALRGNKFAMFSAPGQLNPSLTTVQVGKMVARIEAGDMPPSGPLAAAEADAIRRYLLAAGSTVAVR